MQLERRAAALVKALAALTVVFVMASAAQADGDACPINRIVGYVGDELSVTPDHMFISGAQSVPPASVANMRSHFEEHDFMAAMEDYFGKDTYDPTLAKWIVYIDASGHASESLLSDVDSEQNRSYTIAATTVAPRFVGGERLMWTFVFWDKPVDVSTNDFKLGLKLETLDESWGLGQAILTNIALFTNHFTSPPSFGAASAAPDLLPQTIEMHPLFGMGGKNGMFVGRAVLALKENTGTSRNSVGPVENLGVNAGQLSRPATCRTCEGS